MSEIQEGSLYRHFKGGLYYVHFVAKHTETNELIVVYQEAEPQPDGSIGLFLDKIWCRPIDNFCSQVEVNGKTVPKFFPQGS